MYGVFEDNSSSLSLDRSICKANGHNESRNEGMHDCSVDLDVAEGVVDVTSRDQTEPEYIAD